MQQYTLDNAFPPKFPKAWKINTPHAVDNIAQQMRTKGLLNVHMQ